MAHQLESDKTFYSLRQPAWHQLGFVSEEALSIDEALRAADLDCDWEKHPIYTQVFGVDGFTTIEIPEKFANVRTNRVTGEQRAFGPVGPLYTNHDLREIWNFVDELQGGGATIETLGSLGRGERAFITLLLPSTVKVGGVDVTDLYLSSTTSFDGSQATSLDITPVRVVCANTWRASKRLATATTKIRHTSALGFSASEKAKRILDLTVEVQESLVELGNRLLGITLSLDEAASVVSTLFPFPESVNPSQSLHSLSTGEKKAVNRAQRQRAEVINLYKKSPARAQEGTAWGLFNAVTEWADWYSPVKSSDEEEKAILRAQKVLLGDTEAIKDQALNLLLV